MAEFVGAIDQGTTSTRFMIFNHEGEEVSRHQVEHEQILPRAGWVEHDPEEIWENTELTIREALRNTGLAAEDLATIGLTNQRETTVVWSRKTGAPLCNALVWQDTRNARAIAPLQKNEKGDLIRKRAGLPPATYFSAGKLQWLIENNPGVAEAVRSKEALFGTIDTWVLWNLTGGTRGGAHLTDVTNASRTMLMNLGTLEWDEALLEIFSLEEHLLPGIRPSSFHFGETDPKGVLGKAVPLSGILGDQQAAMVGQVCFKPGEAKNTYGTGNFMLLNLGHEITFSEAGLLTTVCYQWAEEEPVYALEGSIAVTGSAVQWLRDQLGLIESAAEVEELANTVEDSGDVYFVPAFSGLFAPYWRSDARGTIVGLSRYSNRGHLARATLEAICYQSRDIVEAMSQDSGLDLEVIKVDGGATANDTLMQLQADILGTSVIRPKVSETTSLGAAYAAGLAVGFWSDPEELRKNWQTDRQWDPRWSEDRREQGYHRWKEAVEKTFDWLSQ